MTTGRRPSGPPAATAGYSAAQVRAAEAPHLAAGEPLMRRAASALAAVVRREAGATDASGGPVLVLAGSGDNGGDALFAAAELADDGFEVVAVPAGARLHDEASVAALAAGVRILERDDDAAFAAVANAAPLVVDGILGTGSAAPALRGRARELVAVLIPEVERSAKRVIAVDLPSGIHPDDGSVPDPTVLRATITVTFGAVKAGLLREPGAGYAGRVELVDLGLGPELATMVPLVPAGLGESKRRRPADSLEP
ncbi:NAD(P)H-hydrate epimerase [Agromyces aerolatus]|uniref:NAD(P)H-hydrate epimerase n=1 Tax=Agromyces sp. LY-1074 TaxID=3074080 RepID=UPI0028620714|nr:MULTISPECIES: NAD(P)H-hydrate epimerase [unclassified Agromyces]MDR5700800.1 NAD(P)H-hydrate epimerase [Agromyces sp. LY-1074]MDR5707321.1 NAD(P)H-hydrate epimerase [Agromyces sp. LY-1358]